MVDIREKQRAALKQMLNLNEDHSKLKSCGPEWKILIYDRFGQDIISPLLSVKELRELGVTIHELLHSDRDAIPDVPAVYFVQPTEQNLARIKHDFQNGLYDLYYLNFISGIGRHLLEQLASAALNTSSVYMVKKVFDQFLNFISLESDLFVLRHQPDDAITYHSLNRVNITDTEMNSMMDPLVDGLFSVFATMGAVPFIYSSKGNAAEKLAEKLDQKLRGNLKDTRHSLFIPGHDTTPQRPLLIILDRDVDLATPLHHSWTYQALTHDVLDLNLNKVVVEEAAGGAGVGGARSKAKTCNLDQNDRFWMTHKGSPFPSVAEAIQEELEECRKSEEEVKRLKKTMGLEGDQGGEIALSMVTDNTSKLTSAINDLPQMLERKRLLDMHMTLATTLLNAIKTRRLDNLFEMEEKIMGRQTLDRTLSDLIADPECGSPEDKLRLFLIHFMCSSQIPQGELEELYGKLRDAGCDLSALPYLRRCKQIATQRMGGAATHAQYPGSNVLNKIIKGSAVLVMEGVKNFTIKKHKLPVTRIVDGILSSQPNTHEYMRFDPKQNKPDRDKDMQEKNEKTVAVVFMVGSGNYMEYQNLVDYARHKADKGDRPDRGERRVIYGASCLNNASQFLKQLSMLGREIP